MPSPARSELQVPTAEKPFIRSWMVPTLFVATLLSLFVPAPFIRPDAGPILSGLFTALLTFAAGPGLVKSLKGKDEKE